MTTPLYPTPKVVDFVLSEAPGFLSRDNVVVTQAGTALKSGTVLTKLDTNKAAGTFAYVTSTGNYTCGTVTVADNAKLGIYAITFTAATTFDVETPDGVAIGSGVLATPFTGGGITFTLTAGGTPAVAGDTAKITVATVAGVGTFALAGTATGNPTCGAITITSPAIPGVYNIVFYAATKYSVEDPNGAHVGNGATGSAFSAGGLAFTITAGATPAVDGDQATITVSTGNGKYAAYTAGGAAGSADAVLYTRLESATGDFKAVAFTGNCEVNRASLTGLDDTAETQLAAKGIKVRGTSGLPTVATPAL